MRHQAVKVRIYPTEQPKCYLNTLVALGGGGILPSINAIETYQQTGKGLTRAALNAYLPKLKKIEETEWLSECYSQVLQSTTLNLTTAFKNFFEGRARYPRFKSKKNKQSIQFPQKVKVVDNCLKFPGRVGLVKAKIHRLLKGTIKTVTISMTPSGKYFASILCEIEGDNPTKSTEGAECTPACDSDLKSESVRGKVAGIDLGLKEFAIVHDGNKISKFTNPKYFKKHERNLARKQAKLARKVKGSNSRSKARRLVARIHERLTNSRQDYLHKLSRKLVDNNQVMVVENLNVKGMTRNHKLAKAITDVGWGIFVNLLSYKLEHEGKILVEIDRWFPSSKTCSECHFQIAELPLEVREWDCPSCGTHHDRDANAAKNIRAEGIRVLTVCWNWDCCCWRSLRFALRRGRKTSTRAQVCSEAIPIEVRSPRHKECWRWVVH